MVGSSMTEEKIEEERTRKGAIVWLGTVEREMRDKKERKREREKERKREREKERKREREKEL
jgi:hypothetical protein